MGEYRWRPLGQILLERGLISEVELEDALRAQLHEGGRLGEILFAGGLVSGIDLRDALAEQHGLDLRVEARGLRLAPAVAAEDPRGGFPLGRLLVKRGLISEAQLDAALLEQAASGTRLGQVLIASGLITSFTLAAALAEQQGLVEPESRPAAGGQLRRRYELREIEDGTSYSLYTSRNFLDATDLAFAVLQEWEPAELHVVCLADDPGEKVCWSYPLEPE
jgi:hypothetical protein